MKTVGFISLLGIVFWVGFAANINKEEIVQAISNTTKLLCEKNNTALWQEYENCTLKGLPEVSGVFDKCEEEAMPGIKNEDISFKEASCYDVEALKKFEVCLNEQADEEFLQKLEKNEEVGDCMQEVLDRYNVKFDLPNSDEK